MIAFKVDNKVTSSLKNKLNNKMYHQKDPMDSLKSDRKVIVLLQKEPRREIADFKEKKCIV